MGMESPEKMKDNEEFIFVPRSYILPEDYEKFERDSLKEENETWIVKNVSVIVQENSVRNGGRRILRDGGK